MAGHRQCRFSARIRGLRSRGRSACPSRAGRNPGPSRAPAAPGRPPRCRHRACRFSARAIASSWFTMCAARWLDTEIWVSERLICVVSGAPVSSTCCASSAWVLQAGQRRLELMRSVGDELLLRADRLIEPRQQIVDRTHQRRHFLGCLAFVDRAQVVAGAASDALLQLVQRRDAARQRQPDQQHRDRQDHELRDDHALDDLGGQL